MMFVPTLIYLNKEELIDDGISPILIALVIVTILTYLIYLRTALADPGYINSLMFNKAYANNETEVS